MHWELVYVVISIITLWMLWERSVVLGDELVVAHIGWFLLSRADISFGKAFPCPSGSIGFPHAFVHIEVKKFDTQFARLEVMYELMGKYIKVRRNVEITRQGNELSVVLLKDGLPKITVHVERPA